MASMIAARKLSEGGCPELLYMESRWDNVCAGQPKDDREKGHGRKRPERKREGGGGGATPHQVSTNHSELLGRGGME